MTSRVKDKVGGVNPQTLDILKREITRLLKRDKVYRYNDYSIGQMAEQLNINKRYVSLTIRYCFNTNFTTLLNVYRIKEAERMLTRYCLADVNIEDVAIASGFKTRQSFYNYFKKLMGVNPTQFLEKARADRLARMDAR